jgi:hypothetical protein
MVRKDVMRVETKVPYPFPSPVVSGCTLDLAFLDPTQSGRDPSFNPPLGFDDSACNHLNPIDPGFNPFTDLEQHMPKGSWKLVMIACLIVGLVGTSTAQASNAGLRKVVKRFDVVPNIRRANVEAHSGWVILELSGEQAQLDATVAYLEEVGCTVNTMEGDVIEG